MQSTDPNNILSTLHTIRAGLISGLMLKKEVIDWADEIIIREDQPAVFFIDLALLGSKSENDLIHHITEYLNFENPVVNGRVLLGLLYQRYISGQINLEQTVRILFRLKSEVIFTQTEESYIYEIDNAYDLAVSHVYGEVHEVQKQLEKFLDQYKDYSIGNFKNWQKLDKIIDQNLML